MNTEAAQGLHELAYLIDAAAYEAYRLGEISWADYKAVYDGCTAAQRYAYNENN